MKVTGDSASVKTKENTSEAKQLKKDTADKVEKLESYFQPTDEVQISEEGYNLQAKSETKILKMPEKVESFQADSSSQSDDAKMNQIAAKIMNDKPVSPAEEKALKETNPQLYARAKAKAKS